MNIVEALKQERTKLQVQLSAVEKALGALDGKQLVGPRRYAGSSNGAAAPKRTMSAAVKAKIAKKAKERWAKIRAEQGKKSK